jgi:hypothetical protein
VSVGWGFMSGWLETVFALFTFIFNIDSWSVGFCLEDT